MIQFLSWCNKIEYVWIQDMAVIIKFVDMSQGQSFKQDSWTAFERGSWKIFEDDFEVNRVAFKFNQTSQKSTIQFKDSFAIATDGKVAGHKEEFKLWFPIPNQRTLYFRVKNDNWKLLVDNGVREQNGLNYNIHGSVQGKRELGGESVKVGFEVANRDWSTTFRVSSVPSKNIITFYNKTYLNSNKWRVGFINGFNFFQKTWNHSAFQASRTDDCCDIHIRADAGKKLAVVHPRNYLANIVTNYIYNYTPTTQVGLQAQLNLLNARFLTGASAIWSHAFPEQKNTAVKVKADINRNISLAVTQNIEGYGKYTFSAGIADFGQTNRIGYGLQLVLDL